MQVKKLILLFLFLSACMPQVQTTITPSTETASPSESLTPSVSPTATLVLPEDDSSAYQFKSLSEEEYKYIFDALNFKVDDQRFLVDYTRIPKSLVALQSEYLLKFPDSKYKKEAEWGIAINDPDAITPKSQPDKDLMEVYLLEMFSSGLDIDEVQKELESHNIFINSSFEVKNLVGNGENGFVILIRIPDMGYSEAAFAVYLHDGEYHVEKIKDWDISVGVAMGQYYDVFDIGDTNKNGVSEIVIQEEHGFSGTPGVHRQWIYHIEWSNESKEFLSQKIQIFSQDCDGPGGGPCESRWEFNEINAKDTLVTNGYLFTRDNCPDLTFQRISFWDGEEYAIGKIEINSPDKNLTSECLLAWVETASAVNNLDRTLYDDGIFGWKNDDVIYYMEESLRNWSPAMDNMFGAASQDYVKLQLGIWYDQRGEYEKTLFILQELTNDSYSTEYDFMSKMASLYLKVRGDFGVTQACIQVKNAFAENFRTEILEPSSIYSLDKDTLQIWGVVDWKGDLCDEQEMFKSEIENGKFLDEVSLLTWLNDTSFDTVQTIKADFDNNKITDLLVLVDNNELWVFYQTPDGYKARFLDIYIWDDITQVKMLDLSDYTNQQTFLLTANDWVYIIQVSPDFEIETLVNEFYGVKAFNVSAIPNAVRVIINFEDNWEAGEKKIYEWDVLRKNFFLASDFFGIEKRELEKKLFVNYNYFEVIAEIENFLLNAPSEPIEWFSCGIEIGCIYSPPWYVPYFKYLQGISYEQLGDFDKARDIYYQLWNDYPDNVFGVVASMKLELVK